MSSGDSPLYGKSSPSSGSASSMAKPGRCSALPETIAEYSSASTVHGVAYVFEEGQHFLERVIWSLVVMVGVSLAIYWSVGAYLSWDEVPVLTTVATTALPIEEVITVGSGIVKMLKIESIFR